MNRNFAGAAQELGIEENWLREHYRELRYPHRRFGRTVVFSDEDITEINAMSAVRPDAYAQAGTHIASSLLELRPGRAPRGRRPRSA